MKMIIGIVSVLALVLLSASPAASLDGYQCFQPITLTGNTSGAQTDYQMKFNVTYDSDMQADFDDLRFTKLDGITLLDAWLESKTDSTFAIIWVETDTPANGADTDIRMYYDNAGVGSDWNGANTFEFFDDFSGGLTKWTTIGAPNITSEQLVLTDDDGVEPLSTNLYGDGYAFAVYSKANEQDSRFLELTDCGALADRLAIYNSDSDSNDVFTDLTTYSAKTSTGNSVVAHGQSDFTTSFRTYEIRRVTGEASFYQDNALIGSETTSTYLPIIDIGLGIRVWDSSQESTLWAEWALVRKYVANPATHVFGSEDPGVPPGIPALSVWNNVTGTDDHVALKYGTVVMFNATADQSVTWSWTLDGVDQSTSYDNYTHTFTAGFGYYAVTVNATNPGGTTLFTWGVWENIETTAETVPTFSDTSYQMLLDSIDYPPNMEDFGKAMADPFVRMVGVIFYLFIFGVPLLMMYIRQDNMTLPTTLLLLFGSIIIFMLPPQWQIIAGALMTLGFVGILFKLYKERER